MVDETALYEKLERDRAAACKWAYDLLQRNDWVILDTETTGLSWESRIVQIGILRPDGTVLLDQLVKPDIPIPPDASAVHGITDEAVKDAPGFGEIYPKVREVLQDYTIICYNAAFDRGKLDGVCHALSLERLSNAFECAMEKYAEYVGEWSEYHQSYRWQRLPGLRGHTAIADCRATLRVIKQMAEGHKPETERTQEANENHES